MSLFPFGCASRLPVTSEFHRNGRKRVRINIIYNAQKYKKVLSYKKNIEKERKYAQKLVICQGLFNLPAYFLYTVVKEPGIFAESGHIGLAETILTAAEIKYLGD